MTWASFVADGSGQLQLRLVIEGAPDQWVTHRSLAGAVGDGRTRRFGLMPSDIEISERAILQEADLELSGMTLTIEERDDQAATYAFARTPRVVAWLDSVTGDVGVSNPETIDVDGHTRISLNQYVHAGTEVWQVTAKPTSTSITIARAKWQTQLQKHFVEVGAEQKTVPITDAPGAFKGRRAFLYAHGPSELSSTAAGTLIWRGIVAHPPALEALVRWRIQLEPITRLLEQEVAADTDRPTGISGVYYPWTMPFRYHLRELSAASFGGATANDAGEIFVTGYYATAQAFADALNASLPAGVASWTNDYAWIADDGGGHPYLQVTTPSSGAVFPIVEGGSRIDGAFVLGPRNANGATINTVANSASYRLVLATDADLVRQGYPRAWLGTYVDEAVDRPRRTAAEFTNNPPARIFLADNLNATADDAISINLDYGGQRQEVLLSIDSVADTATENDVTLTASATAYHQPLTAETEIRLTRKYTEGADLRTFRGDVIALSVDKNKGSTPWITDEDIASWPDAENAAEDIGLFALLRDYFFSRPVPLFDVLKEEAKLLGGFFYINASYQVAFRRLHAPAATEASSLTIDDSMILAGNWPSWASEKGGIVNQVTFRTGYDPLQDKHTGDLFHVRNVQSISEHSRTQVMEIAPYSREREPLNADTVRPLAMAHLGFFNKFHVVEIDVTWAAWGALLGDTVTLTSEKLPNPSTGTRGLSGAAATVIGRNWRIPGFGRLTLLLHAKRVGGYAPAARVVSTVHHGSNLHTVTVQQNFYAPTGINDTSFFAIGDNVQIYRMNSSSPLRQTGIIQTISPTTMQIQFDGTFSLGAFIHDIVLRDIADAYTVTENAARYVWIADAENNLYNGDDAYEFSP